MMGVWCQRQRGFTWRRGTILTLWPHCAAFLPRDEVVRCYVCRKRLCPNQDVFACHVLLCNWLPPRFYPRWREEMHARDDYWVRPRRWVCPGHIYRVARVRYGGKRPGTELLIQEKRLKCVRPGLEEVYEEFKFECLGRTYSESGFYFRWTDTGGSFEFHPGITRAAVHELMQRKTVCQRMLEYWRKHDEAEHARRVKKREIVRCRRNLRKLRLALKNDDREALRLLAEEFTQLTTSPS